MKKVIEASAAVAIAAKLCKPDVVAVYPITPQTHIPEKIADFVNDGESKIKLIDVESEHSALSACVGAQAAGSRTFTATASQGLALMHEILFVASGLRLPIVMAVANRALSAPINIWCFTKKAEVLMADLTYKQISKVKKGEFVLGKDKKGNLRFTKVVRTFKRTAKNLVKLKTDRFNLITTPEHRFYEKNGHRHWTKASNLKNKNLHWLGHGYKINDCFKRGWLAGIADGDGCFYSQGNRFQFRLKVKDKEIVDTFIKWANHFKYPLRKVNYLEKEGYFIALISLTPETKSFKKFLDKKGDMDFCRGYLAGMFDAEGSGPFKVKQAVIYNNNPEIIKKVSSCLNKLNIKFKKYVDKRSMNYHIKINNVPEFFIKCRPMLERKRKNIHKMTLKSIKSRLKIKEIEFFQKEKEVYNLETETNNYIVNGLLVHNCDHQDSISARDSGWMQFYVESAQEALDTTIMAYRIAENHKVLLPAMVCLDGFTLTHVYEPVDIPSQSKTTKFISKYKPLHKLDSKKPMTFGPIGFPNSFMQFKEQQHEAMYNALNKIIKVSKEFKKEFGRTYGNGLIEEYKLKDADYAVVCMGTICGTARVVVDELRKKGKKVGMIKIKTYRPFPEDNLIKITKNLKGIAVIEKDISLGQQGALFTDLRSTLYKVSGALIHSFIVGLGGRDVTKNHIRTAFEKIKDAKKPVISWLY